MSETPTYDPSRPKPSIADQIYELSHGREEPLATAAEAIAAVLAASGAVTAREVLWLLRRPEFQDLILSFFTFAPSGAAHAPAGREQ